MSCKNASTITAPNTNLDVTFGEVATIYADNVNTRDSAKPRIYDLSVMCDVFIVSFTFINA